MILSKKRRSERAIALSMVVLCSMVGVYTHTQDQPVGAFFTRGKGFWRSKTGFFGQLTDPKSQCENWYEVTPYIAEFWCTVSNIGLLGVGAYFGSPELLVAGSASVVSHAIPKNWLLQIDKLAAVAAATKVIRTYPVLVSNPWLLVPIAAVGCTGVVDKFWGRPNGSCIPHVVWHLSAAAVAALYLQYC